METNETRTEEEKKKKRVKESIELAA